MASRGSRVRRFVDGCPDWDDVVVKSQAIIAPEMPSPKISELKYVDISGLRVRETDRNPEAPGTRAPCYPKSTERPA